MKKLLFAIALIVAGSFEGLPSPAVEAGKCEVHAVLFATIANSPVASLVAGADRARRMDIAMTIWVLKGNDGRVAVVDSGFHRDQYFKQYTVRDFVKPSDAIAPLGITADKKSKL